MRFRFHFFISSRRRSVQDAMIAIFITMPRASCLVARVATSLAQALHINPLTNACTPSGPIRLGVNFLSRETTKGFSRGTKTFCHATETIFRMFQRRSSSAQGKRKTVSSSSRLGHRISGVEQGDNQLSRSCPRSAHVLRKLIVSQ